MTWTSRTICPTGSGSCWTPAWCGRRSRTPSVPSPSPTSPSLSSQSRECWSPPSPLVFQDTEEDSVLHVQHCLPLHDDVHPHGACLLYAPGLRLFRSLGHTSYSLMIICRGENCPRSDGYFSIFSIYVGHS